MIRNVIHIANDVVDGAQCGLSAVGAARLRRISPLPSLAVPQGGVGGFPFQIVSPRGVLRRARDCALR